MNELALVLQTVFLLSAFVLRSALHVRRTGTSGFRAFGATRSWQEAIGAGGIALATVMSFVGVFSQMLGWTSLVGPLDQNWLAVSGACLAAFAMAIVLLAQSHMGASWRIGVDQAEKTALVTGGLFSLTRNPIFLGMLLFWLGTALMVPNALTIAAFLVAWAAIELQVRLVEEPYLLRTHGDAYGDYAARTGRLLPGVGRLSHPRLTS